MPRAQLPIRLYYTEASARFCTYLDYWGDGGLADYAERLGAEGWADFAEKLRTVTGMDVTEHQLREDSGHQLFLRQLVQRCAKEGRTDLIVKLLCGPEKVAEGQGGE